MKNDLFSKEHVEKKQRTHWQQVLLIVVMTPLLFFLGTFLFIWSCCHCDPTSLVFRLAGVQSSKEGSTQITRNFNKFVVSRCHLTTIWLVNYFPFMVERSGWSPYQNISVKIGFEFLLPSKIPNILVKPTLNAVWRGTSCCLNLQICARTSNFH